MNINRLIKLTSLTLVLCIITGLFSSCCCLVPAGITAVIQKILEIEAYQPNQGGDDVQQGVNSTARPNDEICYHDFSPWNVLEEATCENDGLQEHFCNLCGHRETTSINASGHDWENASYSAPRTCKSCGRTEGKKLDAQTDLYNLIVAMGYPAGNYYFWQTATPNDLGTNAAAYLVADTTDKEIILFYSYGDIAAYLWNLRVGNTGNYEVSADYNGVYAEGTVHAETYSSTGGSISGFYCDSSAYSSTMKTILQAGVAIAVYAAEKALDNYGSGLHLWHFGFTDMEYESEVPTPPTIPEPATKYSTEWLEWLVNGDSDSYPYLPASLYMVNYDSSKYTSSPFEVWPADYENKIPKENAHFHMCLMLPQDGGMDIYYDIYDEQYAYTWVSYYRNAENGGSFTKVTGSPWSCVPIGDNVIYRYNLMDYGMEPIAVGDFYEIVVFIYDEYGAMVAWTTVVFEWTDSAEAYFQMAKKYDLIGSSSGGSVPTPTGSYSSADIQKLTNTCPEAFQVSLYNNCYYDNYSEVASSWELWPYTSNGYEPNEYSHFHLCVRMINEEFDIAEGLTPYGNEGNNYVWKVFYRPEGSSGSYQLVECKAWSAYIGGILNVFRLPLLDHGMEKPSSNLEMIIVVCDEYGNSVFWFEDTAVWNQSSEDFYAAAEYYGYV